MDFKTHQLQVLSQDAHMRLDAYVAKKLPDLSRTRIQSLIDMHHVLVNQQPERRAYLVQSQDVINVLVPAPVPDTPVPQAIDLSLVYEDADVVVINKPAGLCVHPSSTQKQDTLVNALLHHIRDLSGIGGVLRPGIVHRLDKHTSGLIIVAKHDRAHQHLVTQFKTRQVKKIYDALVYGVPVLSGEWNQPIGRDLKHRQRFSTHVKQGKQACTRFKRVCTWSARTFAQSKHKIADFKKNLSISLLKIELCTGRTHQIRVHAHDAGYPLVGDPLYVKRASSRFNDLQLNRQALHASSLSLILPSGQPHVFHAVMPADLQQVIALLDEMYQKNTP